MKYIQVPDIKPEGCTGCDAWDADKRDYDLSKWSITVAKRLEWVQRVPNELMLLEVDDEKPFNVKLATLVFDENKEIADIRWFLSEPSSTNSRQPPNIIQRRYAENLQQAADYVVSEYYKRIVLERFDKASQSTDERVYPQ